MLRFVRCSVLMFALAACDDGATDITADTDPDTDTESETGIAFNIQDVLTCGKEGAAGGVNPGADLFRIDLDLEAYPRARCNDRTGAIIYVRRATQPALQNHWVIRTQGGGACATGESCAERWCSQQTNFGMDKMTTSLAPEQGIRAGGVHANLRDNPLAGANHAFLYYCSSDSWSGTNGAMGGFSEQGEGFYVEFNGAHIFDAAIDTLRSGSATYLDAEVSSQTLPDLDDAEFVLFAGASAGAAGVSHNADRLSSSLGPSIPVYALHDSNFGPDTSRLDFGDTPMCVEGGLCDYDSFQRAKYDNTAEGFWGSRLDESCLAFHPSNEHLCFDVHHVVTHHITTPMFVRMDLQDPLKMSNLIEAKFKVPSEGPLDNKSFARIVKTQLEALPRLPRSAEEHASIDKAPGYMGPSCGKHEALGNNASVYDTSVAADGADHTMFELLQNWLDNAEPQGGIASGNGMGCP